MDKEILLKIKQRLDFDMNTLQQSCIHFDSVYNAKIDALFSGITNLACFVCGDASQISKVVNDTQDALKKIDLESDLIFKRHIRIINLYRTRWDLEVGLCKEEDVKEVQEKCKKERDEIAEELKASQI